MRSKKRRIGRRLDPAAARFFQAADRGCPDQQIPTALRDIAQILRRMLRDEIELELKLADSLWSGDHRLWRSLKSVMVLLVNAQRCDSQDRKSHVTTRNVELGLEAEQYELTPVDTVELTVKDTGIGMSAETMLHLFEPFFSTKASSRAVGLVCLSVTESSANIGVITAQSKPGEGTTFGDLAS